MPIEFELTSDNISELTNKIVSKYESINTKSDPCISQKIQEFARKLSTDYEKIYPLFIETDYLHGMYLAFINCTPSNIHDFHQEERDKHYQFFYQSDPISCNFLAEAICTALLVNLRKLTTDIIRNEKQEWESISIARICMNIEKFHEKIEANSKEFQEFTDNLNSQVEIASKSEGKRSVSQEAVNKLWNYTNKRVAHLDDTYRADTSFPILTLQRLVECSGRFLSIFCRFYNYKLPANVNTSYRKTQSWFNLLYTRKYSMRTLWEYIEALASLSTRPEYLNLTPKEASKEIFEKEILENETEFYHFKLIIENYLNERITALKEKSDSE